MCSDNMLVTVKISTVILLFISVLLSIQMYNASQTVKSDSENYIQERKQIIENETKMFLFSDIQLSEKEKLVNKIIMKQKNEELLQAYKNISEFLPSQHFFQAKRKIDESKIFSTIRKLPKGASLHTHILAAVSVDFIIANITYRENICGCFLNGTFKLRFLQATDQNALCVWKQLREYRKDPNFDTWLRKQLTLEVPRPLETYPTADIVWKQFKKIFTTMYDMICYRPVFELYIFQLLNELYLDNVMYTEIKGTFMPLYDLEGTTYDIKSFFNIFIATVETFKRDHPGFVGVRYIHSIYRGVSNEQFEDELNTLIEVKNIYPNFISGVDIIGYEEEGRTLFDFYPEILKYKDVKFFLHAGETNWFGHTDLNLVDAVLLNSTRIGHAFGLPKHPILMQQLKHHKIPVEVCPISNQVLMLNNDPRNHPAAILMANGISVVICNDDPSVWGATGLSYDWYIAFMAMTPKDADIRCLKQFAINSIVHSSMNEKEKSDSLTLWNSQWETFLENMLTTVYTKKAS